MRPGATGPLSVSLAIAPISRASRLILQVSKMPLSLSWGQRLALLSQLKHVQFSYVVYPDFQAQISQWNVVTHTVLFRYL